MNPLRPTLRELEDLFWRAFWTGISTAGALLIAPNVTGMEFTAWETAQAAFLASVVNIVVVFARQKAGTISSEG